jgi:cysteine sulfinate desulfinase/cysteine desulfurase-like protein
MIKQVILKVRLFVALKDLVAISNGSACTSSFYTPSHVIKAMSMGSVVSDRNKVFF